MNSHTSHTLETQPGCFEPQNLSAFQYHGKGKVAHLPKSLRDQINHLLRDGVPYPQIIQTLGDAAKDLRPDNLSEWKKRGYQAWLLEQAWLDQIRCRQAPASELSSNYDATQISHAALQLATLQIFEAFRHLQSKPSLAPQENDLENPGSELPGQGSEPSAQTENPIPARAAGVSSARRGPAAIPGPNNQKSHLDFLLGGDSAAFVRLLNALARASRETMLLQRYQDACARAKAALQPMLDPKRKLTESETRSIVRTVDKVLGLNFNADDEAPAPEPTPPETAA